MHWDKLLLCPNLTVPYPNNILQAPKLSLSLLLSLISIELKVSLNQVFRYVYSKYRVYSTLSNIAKLLIYKSRF